MTTKKRKFTDEAKIQIVLEAFKNGVNPTLRKYNLVSSTYYYWKNKLLKPEHLPGGQILPSSVQGLVMNIEKLRNRNRKLEKELETLQNIINNSCDNRIETIAGTGDETDEETGTKVNVQGALKDITEIKKARRQASESEAKFRNLFQEHSAVKLLIDARTGDINEVNKAAVNFYGWSIPEMKKMNFSQIAALSDDELKEGMELARSGQKNHFFLKNRKADGQEIDVEVFNSPIELGGRKYFYSIVHDVSGRKKAEEKALLLGQSVDQSPVSTVITDIDGNIQYVNPVFSKITGYSFEEVSGKNMRLMKSGHQSPELYKHMWDTLLSGRKWKGEFINKRKNGELYWEETAISPIIDEKGRITNFVAVAEDATERKKTIKDLSAAKEKAEESDRLKSAFLANISHEIRTPMNAILGFASILTEPGLKGDQQREFIEIIQKSGKRMLDTVNDLIDISKIETGQVIMHNSDTDIGELIDNIHRFFLPQAAEKGLKLKLKNRLPSGTIRLHIDELKLNSILTNLVKNALKFTVKGKIDIGCRLKGRFLEFYVKDTGSGIPKEKQRSIFNRFERIESADGSVFEGSGLGLTISKAYAEMLEGEIQLKSVEGQGSTFYLTIPFDGALEEKESQGSFQQQEIPMLQGFKILVAEDDHYSRQMILFMLQKTGATMLEALNGREAIDVFMREMVDLVLLDIRLPEIDGFEVLRKLRSINPEVKVVAQSAYAMLDDIRSFQEAGFTDYLTKPFGQNELYRVLRRYMSSG